MRFNRTRSAAVISTMALAACAMAAGAGGQIPRSGGEAESQPPAAPATTSPEATTRSAKAVSREPDGIVWGPGREVQAGLALSNRYGRPDQRTGLYVFSVYIRNRAKQTMTVDCPTFDGLSVPGDDIEYSTLIQSPLIHCSPQIRDSKRKSVDIRFQQGEERRPISLGPGQVVLVSHWMLRTMKHQAKDASTAKFTQVAFVDPGTYRLFCDIAASWGSKEGRRALLRTGEVAFAVTEEDLAR